jgi:hypothetical protein
METPPPKPLPWSPYLVRAESSYEAQDIADISLTFGEVIEVVEIIAGRWCIDKRRDGKQGYFPFSYAKPLLSRHQCS